MGSFNKRFIIREAEEILAECNRKISNKDEIKIKELKNKNKKLKRKNVFWKICFSIVMFLFVMMIV